jgi:hypothetical protein
MVDENYWIDQEIKLREIIAEKKNIIKQKIYCIGDCLTLGINSDNHPKGYPYFLEKELGGIYEIINLGRTMLRMETLVKFSTLFSARNNFEDSIVLLWCGSNDLYIEISPEIVFENFTKFTNYLSEYNSIVIPVTLLPRSNLTPDCFENNRLVFNELIRNNFTNVII